jgi:radical SAM protein with 4Fe4S-binding SPASM domain
MRRFEQRHSLFRAPALLWDVLVRGRYRFSYDLVDMELRRLSAAKRWNLVRAGGNLVYRRLRPWSYPLHMHVELASFCNARCPVCPIGAGTLTRPAQAMSPERYGRLLDEVGRYLITISMWAWGEPLLHPRLAEILRLTRRHNLISFLATNGDRLADEAVTDALLAEPPTYLIVALDGLTRETNARYRIGLDLDHVLAGLRRLVEMKRKHNLRLPILHLRMIVMGHNRHELPDALEFARRHGADLFSVRTLSIFDTPEERHRQFLPEEVRLQAYEYRAGERQHRTGFVCEQPFWFPCVLADGTVVGCEEDYNAQLPMGRLEDGVTFGQIWRSPAAAAVRRQLRDRMDEQSFCRNCPYRDRETSACSIESVLINPDARP